MPKKLAIDPRRISEADFSALMDAHWKKFDALSAPKKRAYMIKAGWITKEGKFPVYPMDHEPYRPATAI
jgi:hypothetical protein